MSAAYDEHLVPAVFRPYADDLAARVARHRPQVVLELAAGTGATWRQADAMPLPFDGASVDLVACQFGVMFFPDRPAAYAEVARVLRPGGRFLFNCWGPLATHDVEATVIAADLTTAGFDGVHIETV